jgi:hypothetical protein
MRNRGRRPSAKVTARCCATVIDRRALGQILPRSASTCAVARVGPRLEQQRQPSCSGYCRIAQYRTSGHQPRPYVSAQSTWRLRMVRKASVAACLAAAFILALAAPAPLRSAGAPSRLPRQQVVFSYLATSGWRTRTARTSFASPTTSPAVYPVLSRQRFIAFSSNRYGNNDVFVIPRRAALKRLLQGHRRRRRMDPRLGAGDLPATRGEDSPP